MAIHIITKYYLTEKKLIDSAMQQDRLAQKKLYDLYASKMLSVCKYYISDLHHAEDVMIQAFFKAFTHLGQYNEKSSFYTWLSRIMSNACIDFLRKEQNQLTYAPLDLDLVEISEETSDVYALENLENMIESLPVGCRVVFNLYVIENLTHQAIAEKLNISIGTSKSQLAYARKILKQQLKLKENG